LSHEVVRDDAEEVAQVEDVPDGLAENAEGRFGVCERIALAGDGLDERGFAAAVGAEDGNVFAGADGEADVAEGGVLAAHDGDVVKVDEWELGGCVGQHTSMKD
jgi:hypothetical protein